MSDCGCSWHEALHMSWDKSDVQIEVRTESIAEAVFPAHSLVLRCQSSVFDAMLSGGSFLEGKTGKITLQGFSARVVEYLLRYLYLGVLPAAVAGHHVLELLMASHQYEVRGLFRECSERLCASVRVDNACQMYQTAVYLEADDLRGACDQVIRENLTTILENDLFHGLEKDLVYLFACEHSSSETRNAYRRIANYHFCAGETWSDDKLPSHVVLDTEGSPYAVESGCACFACGLYLERSLSDMELEVSDGPQTACFPVHSLVLVSQSKVFLDKWRTSRKSAKEDDPVHMLILGHSPRTLEYLLRYMYTKYLAAEMDELGLSLLLSLAHEYAVQDVVEICADRLGRGLTEINACEVLALSTRLRLDALGEKCLEKIKTVEPRLVVDNCLYFSLDREQLALVLPRETEPYLREAVRQWASWKLCLAGKGREGAGQLDSFVESVVNGLKIKEEP